MGYLFYIGVWLGLFSMMLEFIFVYNNNVVVVVVVVIACGSVEAYFLI